MYYRDDIDRVIDAYQEVNFRFTISPSENLSSKLIPIFSTIEETEYQIKLGYEDMKKIIG